MREHWKAALLTVALLLALAPMLAEDARAAHTAHTGVGTHAGWEELTVNGGVLYHGVTACVESSESLESVYVLPAGSYYLGGNITTGKPIVIQAGTVELCLNGYTLTIGGSGYNGISVGSSHGENWSGDVSFRLYDEAGDHGIVTKTGSSDMTGIYVTGSGDYKGNFEMYGGAISGFTSSGVYVASRAGFTMYGGSICNNPSGFNGKGGGVYISMGAFTMVGGTITGNSATNGGGVYVSGRGTFTMTGGEITGNTATSGGSSGAVGVYNGGTFLLNGGTLDSDVAGAVAVTLFANNGTDTSMTQYVPSGDSTVLTTNPFTYAGHTFAGWNEAADGSGTAYANGASVTLTADTMLYAQWTAIPAPVVPSASSSTSPPPEPFSQPLTSAVPSSFDGGKVAVSPASAGIGDKVTLTATPDEGMRLASLVVDRIGGDPMELTDEGNGVYTFEMPGWRIAVNAAFEPIPAEQSAARQEPVETAVAQPTQPTLRAGNLPGVVLSPQRTTVNGAEATVESYNIGGTNYFSLRDLAALLSGTPAQFNVEFDADRDAVAITRGATYNGAVNTNFTDRSGRTVPSYQTVFIDGVPVSLTAYNIGGNNFYGLRELSALIGYSVSYDEANNTAVIEAK